MQAVRSCSAEPSTPPRASGQRDASAAEYADGARADRPDAQLLPFSLSLDSMRKPPASLICLIAVTGSPATSSGACNSPGDLRQARPVSGRTHHRVGYRRAPRSGTPSAPTSPRAVRSLTALRKKPRRWPIVAVLVPASARQRGGDLPHWPTPRPLRGASCPALANWPTWSRAPRRRASRSSPTSPKTVLRRLLAEDARWQLEVERCRLWPSLCNSPPITHAGARGGRVMTPRPSPPHPFTMALAGGSALRVHPALAHKPFSLPVLLFPAMIRPIRHPAQQRQALLHLPARQLWRVRGDGRGLFGHGVVVAEDREKYR